MLPQGICRKKDLNLLIELVRARFKCDDRNSVLGVLWSLLDPAVMLAAMYFIFKARFGKAIAYYPLYLLVGIVFVNFFVSAISSASRSLVSGREMLLNSRIHPVYIIIVDLSMSLYKFLIEMTVCTILSIFIAHTSFSAIVMLIPVMCAYIAMVLGISFIIAILNCLISDTSHIWFLCSRFLYIVTPIFYSLRGISSFARNTVYYLNPVTPFLISFQSILLEKGGVDGFVYIHSLALGVVLFSAGSYFFVKARSFALEKA